MPIRRLPTHPDFSTTVLEVYTESGVAVKVEETMEGTRISGDLYSVLYTTTKENTTEEKRNLTTEEKRNIPWTMLRYGQTYARKFVSIVFDAPVSLSDSVRETRVLHLMHRGTSDLTMLQARLRRLAYESAFSRRIAVAMGLHVRLGSDPKCLLHLLDADSINMIVLNYY
jgi:hypothetical protein